MIPIQPIPAEDPPLPFEPEKIELPTPPEHQPEPEQPEPERPKPEPD